MRCEICGEDFPEKGTTIEVDGARLLVCMRCRRFGQVVKGHSNRPPTVPSQSSSKIPAKIPMRITKLRAVEERKEVSLPEYDLVDDYSQRIRRAREDLKFTQGELASKLGEKLSIVQKLETGKMRPSDALIDRLERTLRIVLKAPVEDNLVLHQPEKSSSELTIGDIAKSIIKKKDS